MPSFEAVQEQGRGGDTAALQAAVSPRGTGCPLHPPKKVLPASTLAATDFDLAAGAEHADTAAPIQLAGTRPEMASNHDGSPGDLGTPGSVAPMTCLTIGWSIAVPDT